MPKPQPVRVQYRDEFPATPSLIIDGVDMTEKVMAGMTITHRGGQFPTLTMGLAAAHVAFSGLAEIKFDEATESMLLAAGWFQNAEAGR